MVAGRLGAVSGQAVYDAVGALIAAGLARRIEPAGSAALFEARSGDNHHHLVCRDCGAVTDVDCRVGAAPCLEASDNQGFVIDEAEITFWGRCPKCVARALTSRAQVAVAETGGAAVDPGRQLRSQTLSEPNSDTPGGIGG
jgi:Fur family ferric uptake transcriptional regulator